ncbi:MAG: anti-sigma factor [Burkholderiales bacterium]|nr:anti-sigma factor [Burkholderiales bacterium]
MSTDTAREHDIHAFVDNEIDAARLAEVEALLARDPAAATLVNDIREQRARLHAAFDGVLDEAVPARLMRPVRQRSRFGAIAAAFAWLAIGVAVGWMVRDARDERTRMPLPRQAAVAHAAFTPEVRHAVEVPASEEAHLVRWLSKRLGANVRAPRLNELGYELLGGRLLPGAGKPGAQFMYQDAGGRRLTLYVTKDADNRDTAFRYLNENGLHVFYWIDQQLGYALSGDIDKEQILRVARAVYEQLNP